MNFINNKYNYFAKFSLIGLIMFFSACSSIIPQPKPYSKELGIINSKTCQDVKRLYNMNCEGIGLGLEGSNTRIYNLYISFRVARILNRDQARKMLLEVLDIYLKNIRDNKTFIEQFAVDPFDEENINLCIFFSNPNGSRVYDPYIGLVSNTFGKLKFDTNDPENEWGPYKTVFTETLEEARRIIHEQNNSSSDNIEK